MIIKILGTGCSKCNNLEKNVREAIDELGIEATVEKVVDLPKIMKYGVMSTPALVIDEKVKTVGRVLDTKEIKELIKG